MSGETARTWGPVEKSPAGAPSTHLPFTSPLLTGTRVRLQQKRLDFVLPNPSGGKGAYVVSWAQLVELCTPTLHDAVLVRRLHAVPVPDPASVRRLARAVAADGYAGRQAADAARRTQARLSTERLRLRTTLLLGTLRQAGLAGGQDASMHGLADLAGPAFEAMAGRLGWQPSVLALALDQLADAYLPVLPDSHLARIPALLRHLRQGLVPPVAHDPVATQTITRLLALAGQCEARAAQLIERCDQALADPSALLDQWRSDPALPLAPARAVEAILDGWDRICLLWQEALDQPDRARALPDLTLLIRLAAAGDAEHTGIAPLAPSMPPAASEAAGGAVERNERLRIRELELELELGHG